MSGLDSAGRATVDVLAASIGIGSGTGLGLLLLALVAWFGGSLWEQLDDWKVARKLAIGGVRVFWAMGVTVVGCLAALCVIGGLIVV